MRSGLVIALVVIVVVVVAVWYFATPKTIKSANSTSSTSSIGVVPQRGECVADGGFSCTNPTVRDIGRLNFTLTSQSTIYNVELFCLDSSDPLANAPKFGEGELGSAILYAGQLSLVSSSDNNTLVAGETLVIDPLFCYNNLRGINLTAGESFTGVIWANYTLSSGAASSSNPWLTEEVGTVSAVAGS
jgi:hypothetical protein